MTVTYLPATQAVHDEAVRQNFEYIESFGLFLDQGGVGSVLQLLSPQKLQTQLGKVSAQPVAASTVTSFNVPLPVVWPNSHQYFVVLGLHYTASLSGVVLLQWGPYDIGGVAQRDKGSVSVSNGATAQNVAVWWMSLGN